MITIYFLNNISQEKAIAHFDFRTQDFLSYIEEQLYILWELTPALHDWKQSFNRFRTAHFSHCGKNDIVINEAWITIDGSQIAIILQEV